MSSKIVVFKSSAVMRLLEKTRQNGFITVCSDKNRICLANDKFQIYPLERQVSNSSFPRRRLNCEFVKDCCIGDRDLIYDLENGVVANIDIIDACWTLISGPTGLSFIMWFLNEANKRIVSGNPFNLKEEEGIKYTLINKYTGATWTTEWNGLCDSDHKLDTFLNHILPKGIKVYCDKFILNGIPSYRVKMCIFASRCVM
jgi:hypothetical protein